MPRFSSRYAVILALCAGAAGCQTTAPDRFARADVNRDGQLSSTEINDYVVGTVFDSRDANHDGKLTKAEWVTSGDRAQSKNFAQADTNKDGIVTIAEAAASPKGKEVGQRVVRQADTNHDGRVSRAEMTAYYASKE